jgi:lipopolysaccharide biosynthesis protein
MISSIIQTASIRRTSTPSLASEPRLISFYLPQFHPIPENDAWWGKGFTEWTNVAKAKPLFPGHHQPHLPADLGYYDLRLPEARQAQADLAREYGIHGFCYYHYWFNGRRVLERPFNEVLASGQPDFPFCLCWANENWTRVWDGGSKQVLLPEAYSEADDVDHLRWLANAFADPRYIRIGNKPLFLVYRPSALPSPRRTAEVWREEAEKIGIGDLFLCRVECHSEPRTDPALIGFDAAVEFQPDWPNLGPRLRDSRLTRLFRRLGYQTGVGCSHSVYEYATIIHRMQAKPRVDYLRFPCVTPSWDNSARRREGGVIFHGSSPDLYQQWLSQVMLDHAKVSPAEHPIFINAWNEWAEGNHLEPDQKFGRAYLEATRNAALLAVR